MQYKTITNCKKSVQPQEDHCEKRHEIQGRSQEIAVIITIILVNLVPNPEELPHTVVCRATQEAGKLHL